MIISDIDSVANEILSGKLIGTWIEVGSTLERLVFIVKYHFRVSKMGRLTFCKKVLSVGGKYFKGG